VRNQGRRRREGGALLANGQVGQEERGQELPHEILFREAKDRVFRPCSLKLGKEKSLLSRNLAGFENIVPSAISRLDGES
jgi:hypothetical protein